MKYLVGYLIYLVSGIILVAISTRKAITGNIYHPFTLLQDSDPEICREMLRRYPMIVTSFRAGDSANEFARKYPDVALYRFGYTAPVAPAVNPSGDAPSRAVCENAAELN